MRRWRLRETPDSIRATTTICFPDGVKLQIDQYEMKHTDIRQIGGDPMSLVMSKLRVDALKNLGKSSREFQKVVHDEAKRRLHLIGLDATKYTIYGPTISALEKQDQLEKMLWRPVAAGGGGFALVVTDETVADNVQTASKKKESDQN